MSEPTDETPLKPLGSSSGEDTSPSGGQEVQDAPPKYAQALGLAKLQSDMKEAKEKSPNNTAFAFNICGKICNSGASLACLLPLGALAIAMIVVGALYKDKCSGERFIPIWLIVYGSFSLAHLLINMIRTICTCLFCNDNNDEESSKKSGTNASRGGGCFETIISVFLFAWLIAGSVWVFRFYHTFKICAPVNDLADGCCAAVPYWFAFGSIVTIYIIGALAFLALCCCFCCCLCCVAGIGAAAASS